jgi:hypothetical protein
LGLFWPLALAQSHTQAALPFSSMNPLPAGLYLGLADLLEKSDLEQPG